MASNNFAGEELHRNGNGYGSKSRGIGVLRFPFSMRVWNLFRFSYPAFQDDFFFISGVIDKAVNTA